MARTLSLPRLAARLVVVLPFAVFLPAACGGTDTIPFDSDDSATAADGALADGSMNDVSMNDSTVEDGMGRDGSGDGTIGDGTIGDTTISDAADAADALDATDAADALDAADARDARDAGDAGVHDDLGAAASFTVFAGATVTNALVTLITGDLGTYPSTTAIGVTPPVLVAGSFHLGDLLAGAAATDLITAYNNITPASLPGCTALTGLDLGGMNLPPGVYCFSTSAQLTGALVLDSGGNPNAEWFFQVGSTLTTATASTVTVLGASACNVFWQIGTSATLGTGTAFSGNILAHASITLNTNTKVAGRALALTGSVTMDSNEVSLATCGSVPQDAGLDAADAGDSD